MDTGVSLRFSWYLRYAGSIPAAAILCGPWWRSHLFLLFWLLFGIGTSLVISRSARMVTGASLRCSWHLRYVGSNPAAAKICVTIFGFIYYVTWIFDVKKVKDSVEKIKDGFYSTRQELPPIPGGAVGRMPRCLLPPQMYPNPKTLAPQNLRMPRCLVPPRLYPNP